MYLDVHPELILAVAHQIHAERMARAEADRWRRSIRRRVRGHPFPSLRQPDEVALAA